MKEWIKWKFFSIFLWKKTTAWKVSVFGVFLVRIFPHSDWIRRDTEYLLVFSPNVGKYWQEKLRIRTLFTQWTRQARFMYRIHLSAISLQSFPRFVILVSFYTLWKSQWVYHDHITSTFLKAVFHKFYLVHSWILYPNCIILVFHMQISIPRTKLRLHVFLFRVFQKLARVF